MELNRTTNKHIAIIDDNADIRESLAELLELADYEVTAYASADAAHRIINADFPGVLISDLRMPGMDGMRFLRVMQDTDSELPIVMITGHGDIQTAVEAIQLGAYDFIAKPFQRERLLETVNRAMDKRRLVMENRALKQSLEAGAATAIVGQSQPMQALKAKISKLAKADVSTLIHGETGTGKELVARNLHEHSARRDGPFVAINCGALPDTMMEAELFGHEAGAFTDAKKARQGKFEYAHQGTIFLDEIESIPLSLAVKILRVLQERKVERLGANEAIDVDIRIVAATKTDLKAMSERGEFREDLYYRLNVVELFLPPLRQRGEDILQLFRFFMTKAAERFSLPLPALPMNAIDSLMQHNWPGNVRELINVAERYVLTDMLLDQQCLDTWDEPATPLTLPTMVEQYEQRLIEQALSQAQGSIKQTYEALGIPRKTLYDKLAKYGIERQRFLDD
ncbi:MAG TPA: DNA-binding response regulator [Oceanospirillaceae bacterium]|nr:DNA-binding response regulator [Oceanospirillaceae bacterium]